MGMCGRAGQDLFYPAPGQSAAPLVFFLDDIHRKADPDGIPVFAALLVTRVCSPSHRSYKMRYPPRSGTGGNIIGGIIARQFATECCPSMIFSLQTDAVFCVIFV